MKIQNQVAAWASDNLPRKLQTVDAIAAKANDEMAELIRDVLTGQSRQKVGGEVADVVIPLYQLCQKLGLDLDYEVTKKLEILHTRRYDDEGKRIDL